jgi:hypothetical protein
MRESSTGGFCENAQVSGLRRRVRLGTVKYRDGVGLRH